MPRIEEIYWRADASFSESPKHERLSSILGVSWNEAVGIICGLFGNVRRHVPTGNLGEISDEILKRWCHSRKISRESLVKSGWIDPDFQVHGWTERYGEINEKRCAERDKKRAQREKKHEIVPEMSPLSPPYARSRESESESESESDTTTSARVIDGGFALVVQASTPKPPPPVPENLLKLHGIYLEATGRKPSPPSDAEVSRLAELVGWAGSHEAAEVGIRKIGASDWHRGVNPTRKRHDSLVRGRPFACADQFRGWCEPPAEQPVTATTPAARRESPMERSNREAIDLVFGKDSA